jgi:hypothetical protein
MRKFARDPSAASACRQGDRAVPGVRQRMREPDQILRGRLARIRQGILVLLEMAGEADAGTCCDLPVLQCLCCLFFSHLREPGDQVGDDLSMCLVEA